MAKLSARGRTELFRLEKETPTEKLSDRLIDWERKTVSIMSDRTVLQKIDVRFRSDGKKHSYGWKVYTKLSEKIEFKRVAETLIQKGFVVLAGKIEGCLHEKQHVNGRSIFVCNDCNEELGR